MTTLLLILALGQVPGPPNGTPNTDAPSRFADVPDPPPLEQRVATLEQKVAEIEKRLNMATTVKPAVPKPTATARAAPYVSPPGYHRHVTATGEIIEHRDGSANHAGMSMAQYEGPKAPTTRVMDSPAPVVWQQFDSNCPNGNCNAQQRGGFFRGGGLLGRRR